MPSTPREEDIQPLPRTDTGSIHIHSASEADLSAIADIHMAAFPGHALAQLGAAGVRDYYRLLLASDVAVLLVARHRGSAVGFAAGTTQPTQLYRAFLIRVVARRPWRMLHSFARDPRRILLAARRVLQRSLMRHPVRTGTSKGAGQTARCGAVAELSSIATRESHTGRGVGSGLLSGFEERCRSTGSMAIALYTYSGPSERAVVDFYLHRGYAVVATADHGDGLGRLRLMKELV